MKVNKSSVEWLLKKIIESNASKHGDVLLKKFLSHQDLEQAKVMQEEEIEDAHYDGQIEGFTGIPSKDLAKKYYNETFNNGKETIKR